MKKIPISLLVISALVIIVLVIVIINLFSAPEQEQQQQVVIDIPEPQTEEIVKSKLDSYESATPAKGNTYADYLDALEKKKNAADTINQHLQELVSSTAAPQNTLSNASTRASNKDNKKVEQVSQHQEELNRMRSSLEGLNQMERNLNKRESNTAPTSTPKAASVDTTPISINLSDMYGNKPATSVASGFNTPISSSTQAATKQLSNKVMKVIVVQATKIEGTGQKLLVRTLEPYQLDDNTVIAQHTHMSVYVSAINTDRIRLTATSINNNALKLEAYDLDGSLGLYCPASTTSNTTKDIANTAVDAAASAIGGVVGLSTITSSASNLVKPKSISVEIEQGYEFYLVKI